MFDAMVKIGLNPKVLAFCSILLSKHNVIMSSLPHTHTHTHTENGTNNEADCYLLG